MIRVPSPCNGMETLVRRRLKAKRFGSYSGIFSPSKLDRDNLDLGSTLIAGHSVVSSAVSQRNKATIVPNNKKNGFVHFLWVYSFSYESIQDFLPSLFVRLLFSGVQLERNINLALTVPRTRRIHLPPLRTEMDTIGNIPQSHEQTNSRAVNGECL